MRRINVRIRKLSVLLCMLFCSAALTGCQGSTNEKGTAAYSIVCTTFPQYDWLREIIGAQEERFSLTLLLDKGGDLHSYQPTAENIARISSADLFVYVGGESDAWVEDALSGAVNKDMRVVNLMDALGDNVREEELVEGMQCAVEEHESGELEYDEHIWLSLKNAAYLTSVLSETVQELDAENAQDYAANAAAYISALEALDQE